MKLLLQIKWFLQDHVMVWIKNRIYGIQSVYDPDDILTGLKYIDTVILKDGSVFKATKNLRLVMEEVILGYDWSDMRDTDILLDIGAHIGSVTIRAARKVKHVFAIEPLYTEELRENIRLSGITNVTVLPLAIGNGSTINLTFQGKEKSDIQTYPFKEIVDMCGGKVDFLKCDCEGGEWFINKSDLDGIRRIEIEIHPKMKPTEKSNPELVPYIMNNWNTTKTYSYSNYILHAKKTE
jgi:FkbM family methyltransferase